MSSALDSVRAEYARYRALAEGAIRQLDDASLCAADPGGNSIATLVWHLSGNFQSRFTDFLTTDGEKPWRQRDDEFAPRSVSRDELMARWSDGWAVLEGALGELADSDLDRSVTIRRQPLRVHQALLRSLAHAAYHVGQIVLLAKAARGEAWESLSIPLGGSAAYNAAPTSETPTAHADRLRAGDRASS